MEPAQLPAFRRRRATAWKLTPRALSSLDELLVLTGLGPGPVDPPSDETMRRLVGLARHDDLAARVVLQRMLPGLSTCAKRNSSGFDTQLDALDELLSEAWTVIRSFPIERRDRYVIKNLLRDCEYRAFLKARRRMLVQEVTDPARSRSCRRARRSAGEPAEPFGITIVELLGRARTAGMSDARCRRRGGSAEHVDGEAGRDRTRGDRSNGAQPSSGRSCASCERWPTWHESTAARASAALADQPLQMLDQRRDRALDHIEHLGVGAGRPAPRIGEVLVAGHREGVPPTQQLDLHRLDRRSRSRAATLLHRASRSRSATLSRSMAMIRSKRAKSSGWICRPTCADVVAAQPTLVRRQRVGKVADVVAPRRRRIEGDVFGSALPGDVRGHGVRRWRSAVVSQADEQHAEGLRHDWRFKPVGVKRRNRRLLVTTKTLDDAIAALATIGDSNHDMASGIAATL